MFDIVFRHIFPTMSTFDLICCNECDVVVFVVVFFFSVSILGSYNYSAADFVERDVYRETIRTYLTSGQPFCATDPPVSIRAIDMSMEFM